MESGISAYIDFPGSGGFTFRVFLDETYNITENYSYVPVTGISAQSKTYAGTWYPGGTVSVSDTVVGTMDYGNPATHAFTVYSAGDSWIPLGKINNGADFPWASAKITHNADGSKTISVSVNVTLWRKSGDPTFKITGTKSVTLTTIPRASIVAGSKGTLGIEHTLSLTRYAETFRNTLTASCGDEAVTIGTGIQVDSVKWTPPIAWSAHNTEGTTVQVKVVCTTYSGETTIGSTDAFISFDIPDSVVPSVSAVVDDVNGYSYKYGSYIQSKSQAEVAASGSGAYGSTITEYSVSNGAVTKIGDLTVFDLPNTGEIKFTVTATDSRGRTATAEAKISVVAYFAPTVTILAAYRSDEDGNQDDDGAYATVVFKANIDPIEGKNSAIYIFWRRVKGSSSWVSKDISSYEGNYSPDGATFTDQIELDRAYEFCVTAKDDFNSIHSIYRTVQVAFFLLSVNRAKKSVGIGQKATEAGLCAFGIPAKFNAGVNVDGKTLTFAYNESIGGYVLIETEG